jgi:hypothetical protein
VEVRGQEAVGEVALDEAGGRQFLQTEEGSKRRHICHCGLLIGPTRPRREDPGSSRTQHIP